MPSFWDKVQVENQDMELFVSTPTGAEPFPAVLVCQHGGGVDQFIQTICDRLAQAGYAAVAPNLFHRIGSEMLQDGSQPIQHLRDSEIRADIDATVDFLLKHSAINDDRIGITGFCMGGRVAWLGAATNPNFKAAAPYYGGNIMVPWGITDQTPFELTGGINCPVLFHFGELDLNPSRVDLRTLDDELLRFEIPHQFYTYPGADHAFMDFTAGRFNQQAADESWPRTLEFFTQHLKESPATR